MFVDIVSIRIKIHSAILGVETKVFVNPYVDDLPEAKKDIRGLFGFKPASSSTDWKQHWKEQFEIEKQIINSPSGVKVQDTVQTEPEKKINIVKAFITDMKEVLIDDMIYLAIRFETRKARVGSEKLHDRKISSDTLLRACDSLKKEE
jgi:hypothetical protein